MSVYKKIIKCLKQKDISYLYRNSYIKYYKKNKLNEKNILIEPQQGKTINGNMFYIIKELASNQNYNDYIINVALNKESIAEANSIIEYNEIKNIRIVKRQSKEYFILLASAKYLFTDTSFPSFFIKKDGQIILNTWHGTPLKYLGKNIKNDFFNIGNVQKNFIVSDYLLYPNEYMKNHMLEDYMLENICHSKLILAGYPRNTAFFDFESREKIKKELNLEKKEVLVYMPTWRENKTIDMQEILLKIEENLKENQILFVTLHPLDTKGIDFTKFSKIRKFPTNYETYQFLNIADCLITDYSSVFFDFALTKRKIVLFCYDEQQYVSTRGLYLNLSELPFDKASNIEQLINCINSEKKYDETEFIERFCRYDDVNVTKKICETVILNSKDDFLIEDIKNNNKKNILMYVGNLAKNGITSSLRNLLENIDLDENNYYLTFSAKKVKDNKEQLLDFPKMVKYISTTGRTNMTICQKMAMKLYRLNLFPAKIIQSKIDEIYGNEIKRLYGDIKFDSVIQFGGYEYQKIMLYSVFDSNTIIYVHSDMINEIKTRRNQHKKTLQYAYKKYKKVAVVNEDLIEPTMKISKKRENIFLAHNIVNYKKILEKAQEDIVFDSFTESNVTEKQLKDILNSDCKKYITIGRFSPEKGHERLIKAFEKIYQEDKNCYLIIIGGTGKLYKKTLKIANNVEAKNNIIIIKSISNPYSIMKKCNYFVLSSYYEGFGLVIAEADVLNKPVISTNIIGPRNMLEQNGGKLVENSELGLYEGMKKLKNNEIRPMNIDFEKYNNQAIEEFYKLIC